MGKKDGTRASTTLDGWSAGATHHPLLALAHYRFHGHVGQQTAGAAQSSGGRGAFLLSG